jgi:hypothetical protein
MKHNIKRGTRRSNGGLGIAVLFLVSACAQNSRWAQDSAQYEAGSSQLDSQRLIGTPHGAPTPGTQRIEGPFPTSEAALTVNQLQVKAQRAGCTGVDPEDLDAILDLIQETEDSKIKKDLLVAYLEFAHSMSPASAKVALKRLAAVYK